LTSPLGHPHSVRRPVHDAYRVLPGSGGWGHPDRYLRSLVLSLHDVWVSGQRTLPRLENRGVVLAIEPTSSRE
jgi:hypothetical protein